jgi:hypothetical protein
MTRRLAIVVVLALLPAASASAQFRLKPTAEETSALRLMNDTEFTEFLRRLDADIVNWKSRLRAIDVNSLRVGPEDAKELRRSYHLCVVALESARGDIEQLTPKQTLKLDLLLLMDLSELARSLDRLSSDLASPVTVEKPSYAQKSLGWARDVLSIDVALAAQIHQMQHHLLAMAGLLDAALDRAADTPGETRK